MKIISLVLLLLISCTDRHNNSIDNLIKTFLKWHNKYSPDLFNISDKDKISLIKKQFIGKSFYGDLKRFSIELNQINKIKLSNNRKSEYSLLSRYLDENIFNYEKNKYQNWNLILFLKDIHLDLTHFLTIYNKGRISSEEFNNKLNFLSLRINYLTETIIYKYPSEEEREILDYLLDQITSLIFSSDLSILTQALNNFKVWYNEEYHKFDNFNKTELKANYEKNISIKINSKINIDSTIQSAEHSIKFHENKIFKASLPIYLSNNDEPIWTDYQDTLNIINWMTTILNNINNSSDTYFNEQNIIDFSSLYISDRFNIDENILPQKILFRTSDDVNKHSYVYNRVEDMFIALNYSNENNPIKRYSNIINDLIPGELFINYITRNSKSLMSKVYINKMYFYSFKILLIKDYIEFISKYEMNEKLNNNFQFKMKKNEYFYMLNFHYNIDRIKDAITALASIRYHYYDIPIDDTINKYKRLILFSDDEIKDLKLEILSFEIDSIIKFKAYDLLSNLIKETDLNSIHEFLVDIFKENPNLDLDLIKHIVK